MSIVLALKLGSAGFHHLAAWSDIADQQRLKVMLVLPTEQVLPVKLQPVGFHQRQAALLTANAHQQ